jgi:hypothetical protein
MREIKTWDLNLASYTQNDITWIQGLGCDFIARYPTPLEISLSNGITRHMTVRKPWLEITTISEKQQSMLQLKYGDSIFLISINYEV